MRTIASDAGPIHVVSTLADAAQCWDWLTPYRQTGQLLTWDGETTSGATTSPWGSTFRLRTAQFSNGHCAWVVQAEKPGMLDVVRQLTHAHPRWCAHFAENDIRYAERGAPGSVRLDSIEPHFIDSQVALAWYDPRTVTSMSKYPGIGLPRALKPSSQRILKTDVLTKAQQAMYERFRELAPVGWRTPEKCKSWGFDNIDVDDDTYLRYGGLDAIIEYRLFEHCYREVIKRNQKQGLDDDLFLQWHIDLMTFRGLPLDADYVKWLAYTFEQISVKYAHVMHEHGVKLSGLGACVGNAFTRLGVKSPLNTNGTPRTPDCENDPDLSPSWNAEVLKYITSKKDLATLPEHHRAIELAEAISALRKAGKFRAAYINPMLDALGLDHRLHCSFRNVGCPTSRQSAERPPLHQLPKRRDKMIRAAFTARAPRTWLPDWVLPYVEEEWVIISGDYSKGEPRVMAARSGDQELQRDLESGNFYANVAARTYGDVFREEEIDDPAKPGYGMYQNCKNGYMAAKYGCGVAKEAALLATSHEEAKDVLNRWAQTYTVLEAHSRKLNRQKSVTLASGWVAPLWDRYFINRQGEPEAKNKDSRLGLCYDTQGNLAVILRRAMRDLIRRGWSWSLVLAIHDEIVLCVPKILAHPALQVLNECMSMTFYGFPLRCDAKICGPTWVSRDGFGYDPNDATQLVLGTDENGVRD